MLDIEEVLTATRRRLDNDLPRYSNIVSKAIRHTAPVYFSKPYEEFFWHCATTIPNWLPQVVAACAQTEGNGAHSLLAIWSRVNFHRQAEAGLLQHAKDEAGHARLFVKLARLAFEKNFSGGALDTIEKSLRPIESKAPRKSEAIISERMLIDYLVQLNIVEIRTRVNLRLLAPFYYALTPKFNKPKVERILKGLERDELSHIAYTASIIDEWARDNDVDRLTGVYACRLQNYNQHTLDHCNAAKFDYGQGKFPKLFAPSCGGVCKLNMALDRH